MTLFWVQEVGDIMKVLVRAVVLSLLIGAGLTAMPALAYQGILNGPGLLATGTWPAYAGEAAATWDVVLDTAGFYHYNYRAVLPEGAAPIGTFLLEVDPSLTINDIFNYTGDVVVGDFSPDDYPDLPRAIHGIGLFNIEQTRTSFSFSSVQVADLGRLVRGELGGGSKHRMEHGVHKSQHRPA